ncbi:MAG: hypothetical protein FJ086_09660 [Deltaproteobacteria bacterium]|nr:hypothetical protein [Deltaproteobacteria bacterium]
MGKPLDCRSDIFSLGTVLYEWITGFKLFTGESEVAILKNITEGKIYKPSYFKSDIPDAVEAILMKALEKDRDKRYQTAWEMQYDLDQFLSQNEFTPSNIHLSNFLRQLFLDEMEDEKARLAQASPAADSSVGPPPPPPGEPEEILSGVELIPTNAQVEVALPTQVARGGSSDKLLTVPLSGREYDVLVQMAERNRIPAGTLARELLSAVLKYR